MATSTTTPPPSPTLVCTECQHSNEHQRVFCHNCGSKLDRTVVVKEVTARKPPAQKVRQRLKSLTRPNRGATRRVILNVLRSLLVGAGLAVLASMLLPPHDRPQLTEAQEENARQIDADLEAAQLQRTPVRLTYREADVNAYLKSSAHAKKDEESFYGFHFKSVFVHFRADNTCETCVAQAIFDYPCYFAAAYGVHLDGGKLRTNVVGGRIGRLWVPGFLMQFLDFVVTPFQRVEHNNAQTIQKLGSITFGAGTVEMVTRPGL